MNKLLRNEGRFYRVLDGLGEKVLVIDCLKRTMPYWVESSELSEYASASEEELREMAGMDRNELTGDRWKVARERYTKISAILPFLGNEGKRTEVIEYLAANSQISKQTVRKYLCLYLAFQDVSVLAPQPKKETDELSQDERNIRWALNKFFYTQQKNSLKTAYTSMLQSRYCDEMGVLKEEYPSFYQFRYFYRKTKKLQNYCIKRNGIKDYQKNSRPLLGEGVVSFAPGIGVGMLDATVCDIYLVDDVGQLVGRPILTACVDAYSGLCCGYALSWEGGTYSLRGLMLNILADKEAHCKKHGVIIDAQDWPSNAFPGKMVTDKGSEYISETFSQLSELGVTLTDLPAYRPELKSKVGKFFDLIQTSFKSQLKGKGVIEPDFQERGAHDYRKDACLTMEQFERIVLHCIIYYNRHRIQENFPYTDDMVRKGVRPYAAEIWSYGLSVPGANLIPMTAEKLILTLMPRTTGKFARNGLQVNKLRYRHESFTEQFLKGGSVTVAYNPEDVSCVWLIENGSYIRFELIESRFSGMNLDSVECVQAGRRELAAAAAEDNLQAQINLAAHIQAISQKTFQSGDTKIKSVRGTRKKEQNKNHRDYAKEAGL